MNFLRLTIFSKFFMIFWEFLEIKTAKIKEEVHPPCGDLGPHIVRYVASSYLFKPFTRNGRIGYQADIPL